MHGGCKPLSVTIAAPAPGAPGRAFSRAAAWPPSASYGASRRAESQPCDSSCKVAAMAARASAIIEIVTTLRKYGSSAGRSLAYRKPLVDRLAAIVDVGGTASVAHSLSTSRYDPSCSPLFTPNAPLVRAVRLLLADAWGRLDRNNYYVRLFYVSLLDRDRISPSAPH